MKKMTYALLGLSLSLTGFTHAAGYGVVDLEKVVESSSYLKQQNASLEQAVKPQTAKLEQITKGKVQMFSKLMRSIRQKLLSSKPFNKVYKLKFNRLFRRPIPLLRRV